MSTGQQAGPSGSGDALSVAALVDEAVARAGSAPTDLPFTSTLELLAGSCMRNGKLSEIGATVLRKVALRHLRNLLELAAHVACHPEVGQRPLGPAVVVTGLPRTGTTLLHNLLALDPTHRALRFWEALHPVPPGTCGPSIEAQQARAATWLDAFYRLVPDFQAIHRATPTGPEECDALLQNTFASQHFDDMFDAPEYSAWLATAPLVAEYRHYALQLRVLAGMSPPETTWALKSPSHLGHLDALLDAVPEAVVVVCHRDPRQAVASYASLIHTLRRPYGVDVSATAIGRQALTRAATAMDRALRTREAAGDAAFVDVSYPELARDPLTTVRGVYRQLGRSLDSEAERRMRQWVDENPQHGHGPHRYDLDGFGLSEAEVLDAFAHYLDRFAAAVS